MRVQALGFGVTGWIFMLSYGALSAFIVYMVIHSWISRWRGNQLRKKGLI